MKEQVIQRNNARNTRRFKENSAYRLVTLQTCKQTQYYVLIQQRKISKVLSSCDEIVWITAGGCCVPSTLGLAAFLDARDHDDGASVAFPNHRPKVANGLWRWPLGCDVRHVRVCVRHDVVCVDVPVFVMFTTLRPTLTVIIDWTLTRNDLVKSIFINEKISITHEIMLSALKFTMKRRQNKCKHRRKSEGAPRTPLDSPAALQSE